ncbi:MAG: hypothetical protein EXR79_06840 [Myxococcales bacterium]|nr:hypothetical protein [Myxococcales bacterium]
MGPTARSRWTRPALRNRGSPDPQVLSRRTHRRGARTAAACGLGLAVLASCAPRLDPDAPWSASEFALLRSLSPVAAPAPNAGNRFADDPAAAALGQALFFDKGLSANGQVACATCHQPARRFTDGLRHARGVGEAPANAPTLLGAHSVPFLFRDGRKDSLWSQALGPLEAEPEHGFDRMAAAHHVAARHRQAYEATFGPLPPLQDSTRFPAHARPVPLDRGHPHDRAWQAMAHVDRAAVDRVFAHIGKAIEAYERKLVPGPAPFDRYVAAVLRADPAAATLLPTAARRGLRHFIGAAQCVTCHNGPWFTDGAFHNLGLPRAAHAPSGIDVGRSLGAQRVKEDAFRCGGLHSDTKDCPELRFLNPRFADFLGAFKTPSLRNVETTAPYMHTGQFATLAEVLAFYQSLPGTAEVGHRELTLSLVAQDIDPVEIIAFLHTLTSPLPDARWLHP